MRLSVMAVSPVAIVPKPIKVRASEIETQSNSRRINVAIGIPVGITVWGIGIDIRSRWRRGRRRWGGDRLRWPCYLLLERLDLRLLRSELAL